MWVQSGNARIWMDDDGRASFANIGGIQPLAGPAMAPLQQQNISPAATMNPNGGPGFGGSASSVDTPPQLTGLLREYGAAQRQPSWGVYGVPQHDLGPQDFGPPAPSKPMLTLNGREMAIPAANPNDWIQQQVSAAQGPARPLDDRLAMIRASLDAKALPYAAKDNFFKQFAGMGMREYDDHQLKTAIEIQKQKMEQSKFYQDQYEGIGKQYGMSTADLLQSSGYHYINPQTGEGLPDGAPGGQHVFSAFKRGEDVYDPSTGTVVGKKPGRFVGVLQGEPDMARRARQVLGFDDTPVSREQQQAQLNEVQRQIALAEAQRTQPSSPHSMGELRLMDEADMARRNAAQMGPAWEKHQAALRAQQAVKAAYYARPGNPFDYSTPYMP